MVGSVKVALVGTISTSHKLGRTVCNFAKFGRTNMIQVGIPYVSKIETQQLNAEPCW